MDNFTGVADALMHLGVEYSPECVLCSSTYATVLFKEKNCIECSAIILAKC